MRVLKWESVFLKKNMARSCDCPTDTWYREFALVFSPLHGPSGFACSVSSLSQCPLRNPPGESRCQPRSRCSAHAWIKASCVAHLFYNHVRIPAGVIASHFTSLAPLRVTECQPRHPSLTDSASDWMASHISPESGRITLFLDCIQRKAVLDNLARNVIWICNLI